MEILDKSTINTIFDCLMRGDGSVLISDNIRMLNSIALMLYNTPNLNGEEIECLKKIIMICNVLYNRTDMTVLPIEDGFYDLLLEKYKQYDRNFQVGSAVVEFRNFIENDLDSKQQKVAKCPIYFIDHKPKDELRQDIFDKLMLKDKYYVDRRDFATSPISFNNDYISKRSHNTEHNHPTLVGTLDKSKFVWIKDAEEVGVVNDPNVKILERDFFLDHIKNGIINPRQEIEIVCELKYDGISVEADCGLELISARTRGDTGIGIASDITPILQGYTFKHADCMIGEEPVGVKFEAIMTKHNLEKFNSLRDRSYANCRSAIVGLFGASDAYLYRDLITLIPLALDTEQFKYKFDNRIQEIEFLNKVFISHGEPLRYCYFKGTYDEILYFIKCFWDEAKVARDYINFMYDGIVVSYVDPEIRSRLGRKNFINKYSMAVKFDPLEKETIFRGYTYEVGQHGNITPMIHYDPVEFLGTIHTKSTGSSLNRFNELALKYGDFISVKYVNDVMPYVSRVECEHNRNNPNEVIKIITNCPVCNSRLVVSDSGKSLLCPNMNCPARATQRMVNMFSKLNIKGFADATFKAIPEIDHLYKLYLPEYLNTDFYIQRLGIADGTKLNEELVKLRTEPINDYFLIGSLGFTSIAYKKWQAILQYISVKDLSKLYTICNNNPESFENMLRTLIPGIGEITPKTIATEWSFFKDDIDMISSWNNLISSVGNSSEAKMQIRFTGFRNLQLSQQLITAGYDADDNASITKKTDILLIPYEGYESSKVSKAKNNPNTKIVPIQEFMANMKAYGVEL